VSGPFYSNVSFILTLPLTVARSLQIIIDHSL